jgi:1-acyl-sn-glycerol-3-phosphate acyltransferase
MHRSINDLRVEVDPSSRFRAPVSRTLSWVGDRLSDVVVGIRPIRFSARGFDARKFESGATLIIANHISLLDTLAIRRALPGSVRARTATVGARDFFVPSASDRGVRRALRSLSCFYVTNAYRVCLIGRGDDMGDGIPRIAALLRSGWHVILFPEGTRSRSGQLGRFRRGFAHLAESTGAAVIPVGIRGTDGVMSVGNPMIRSGRIDVQAGEPCRIARGESGTDFLGRLRAEVQSLADRWPDT